MPITAEARKAIFSTLKKTLEKYSPPMVAVKGTVHDYELIGNKPVPYGSTKKIVPGMFFAALAHRKDSVTFHFFPCYMNRPILDAAPALTRQLKGKTCFHFQKPEQVNVMELNALLRRGVQAWEKLGYMA